MNTLSEKLDKINELRDVCTQKFWEAYPDNFEQTERWLARSRFLSRKAREMLSEVSYLRK